MKNDNVTYSLSAIDNQHINTVRKLTEDDFKKYSNSISKLAELSNDENLFKIVELNYIDLKNAIDISVLNFINRKETGSFEISDIFLNINRLILNFLSSIRTFLDHTETRLKRKYGGNSNEMIFFKTATSHAYDNEFSYRFLYKLRNYSQHCGLPTGSISASSSLNEKKEEVNNLILYLNRDSLILQFEKWGKLIKEELINKPDKFDILPLVDKKFELLYEINEKITKDIYSKLQNDGQLLMNLIWETQELGGTPCLIKTTGTGTELDISMHWFPYRPISKITGVNIQKK